MSNMSHNSKLKGNEYRFRSSFSERSEYAPTSSMTSINSSFSTEQDRVQLTPRLNSQPQQKICAGRGMVFKQLSEEFQYSSVVTKKTKMDFSNASIEQHFKHLREENEKKLEEKRLKWREMFSSN